MPEDEKEPVVTECNAEDCELCEAGVAHLTITDGRILVTAPDGTPVGETRNIREDHPPGTRVRVHDGMQTEYLGLGTIVDYVPEMSDSPKIEMDDGTEQFGFGCWWETIEQFEKKFAKARKEIIEEEEIVRVVRLVPVDDNAKIVDVELTDNMDTIVVVAMSDGTRIRMDGGEEQGDLHLREAPKDDEN